jgi:glycosyltransferase A (GT-A) superfamily protein (DUF2064 family)
MSLAIPKNLANKREPMPNTTKPRILRLLGLAEAQQLAAQLHDEAVFAIKPLGCRTNALFG